MKKYKWNNLLNTQRKFFWDRMEKQIIGKENEGIASEIWFGWKKKKLKREINDNPKPNHYLRDKLAQKIIDAWLWQKKEKKKKRKHV